MVSFTSQSLYPRRKSRLFPFDKRLGGIQIRSGRYGEEELSCLCRESNLGLPAILSEVSGLQFMKLTENLHQARLYSVLCPSSGILNTEKHSLSETESVSVFT
jgi:hypothetical protein